MEPRCRSSTLCGISSRFQLLSPSERQVAHALLTRPPLTRAKRTALCCERFKIQDERFKIDHVPRDPILTLNSFILYLAKHSVLCANPFDLHVLGTPPAFVLSQDQTLNIWYIIGSAPRARRGYLIDRSRRRSRRRFQLSKELSQVGCVSRQPARPPAF